MQNVDNANETWSKLIRLFFEISDKEAEAEDNKGDAEELTHGESVEGEVAELRVGFTDKFYCEAENTVTYAKNREVSSLFVWWGFTA